MADQRDAMVPMKEETQFSSEEGTDMADQRYAMVPMMDETELNEQSQRETGLSREATFRDYCRFLLNAGFLFVFLKRLLGIFMMCFDMGSDLKLAYDLATNPAAIAQNDGGHELNLTTQNTSSYCLPNESAHIPHPFWFALTLVFFYLPHFSRVWSTNLQELLTKFLFHGFRPINMLEKEDEAALSSLLPRWAFVISFIDENKYRLKNATILGKIFLITFWPFIFAMKAILFLFMPLLVVARQLRNITIVFQLEAIKINLRLSNFPGMNVTFKREDMSTSGITSQEIQFGPLEKLIFENPKELIKKPNETEWDKVYVSEQSKLLDSLMTLKILEKIQECLISAICKTS